MTEREEIIEIAVGARRIAGTVVPPTPSVEGMLFVHGWPGTNSNISCARGRWPHWDA
jgi:hypothetical protein